MSISFPPEDTNRGWHRNLWLHSDTSYLYDEERTTESKECYQAWVSPVKVRKGDATLAVLEGSHKYHKRFSKSMDNPSKDNWYKLTDEEVDKYIGKYGCKLKRIKCPTGSMVIWDSRTIHCGQQPMKERPRPNIRICIYVCMMPREWCTEKNLKKRIEIFEQLRLTKHHPLEASMFPKNPRTYGKEFQEILPPKPPGLTKIGKRLVGY